MSDLKPNRTGLIAGFKGENRQLPDVLLEPTVLRKAQNVDFKVGTLKRRPGYVRMHDPAQSGGDQSQLHCDAYNSAVHGFMQIERDSTGFTMLTLASADNTDTPQKFYFSVFDSNCHITTTNPSNHASITKTAGVPSDMTLLPSGDVAIVGGTADSWKAYYTGSAWETGYLSPVAADVSSTVIGATGGSGDWNGYARWFITFVNSKDNSESNVDTSNVLENAVAATADQSSAITVIPDPSGTDPQVDKMRIYRTTFNASSPPVEKYYLVEEVAVATSYTDTTSDADLILNEPYNVYRGAPPANPDICFYWGSRLWIASGNFLYYSEVEMAAGESGYLPVQSAFFGDNYVRVGLPPNDRLTGSFVASNQQVLLMSEQTVYLLAGAGPGLFQVEVVSRDYGCVSPRTVAASKQAVYWLSHSDVVAMPLPLGSGGPQSLTENSHADHLFPLWLTQTPEACGAYDPVSKKYYCSFRGESVRVTEDDAGSYIHDTFVWDERVGVGNVWRHGLLYGLAVVNAFSTNVYQLLLGVLGGRMVHLGVSDADGIYWHGGQQVYGFLVTGSRDMMGIISSSGATNQFTETGSSWAANDYVGLPVTIISGTTGLVLTSGWVTSHTGDTVTFSPDNGVTLTAGDIFYFGSIYMDVETARIDAAGDRSVTKGQKGYRLWLKEKQVAALELSFTPDEDSAVQAVINLTASDREYRDILQTRGKELVVGMKNFIPDGPIEVEAIQLGVEGKDA